MLGIQPVASLFYSAVKGLVLTESPGARAQELRDFMSPMELCSATCGELGSKDFRWRAAKLGEDSS